MVHSESSSPRYGPWVPMARESPEGPDPGPRAQGWGPSNTRAEDAGLGAQAPWTQRPRDPRASMALKGPWTQGSGSLVLREGRVDPSAQVIPCIQKQVFVLLVKMASR